MGGSRTTLTGRTKAELRKKVQEWASDRRSIGLVDIRLAYDTKRVRKTKDGYSIQVWAHS